MIVLKGGEGSLGVHGVHRLVKIAVITDLCPISGLEVGLRQVVDMDVLIHHHDRIPHRRVVEREVINTSQIVTTYMGTRISILMIRGMEAIMMIRKCEVFPLEGGPHKRVSELLCRLTHTNQAGVIGNNYFECKRIRPI